MSRKLGFLQILSTYRRAPISMGPCRLNSGSSPACTHSWSILLPSSPRGPSVASRLKGTGPIPQVGLGRAAVLAYYRNWENLDLGNVHKLPQQTGAYLSDGGPVQPTNCGTPRTASFHKAQSCKGAGRINTPGLKPDGQISLSQNFF